MPVVSVRLDAGDVDWIRRRGLKPGAFARLAIHEAVRRAEVEENLAWLSAHRLPTGVDSVAFVRRERDSR